MGKLSILLALFTLFPLFSKAQKQRPKIGLVLSGGGAKGVAHVGALKVIEEAGIPVDYICGTSMGAIVGGLYAIGYNAEELDSIIRAQDWMFLFSDKIDRTHRTFQSKVQNDLFLFSLPLNKKIKISSPTGIMKGQSILNKFSDLTIGYHDMESFNDLPIPFSCVAADLISGKEIVMQSGNLPLAMRASMSVPGFFEPVPKDSMIMIDGGVLNNFPVDVVRKMGADIIIGIDLSTTNYEEPKYKSLLDIANRIAFLSGEDKYAQNKKDVDIYINPNLKGFEAVDFKPEAIDTMISRGEVAARASWKSLIKLKKSLRLRKEYIRPQRILSQSQDTITIDSLRINGLKSYDEKWLKHKIGFVNHQNIPYSHIEKMLWTLQGMNVFKSVSYKLVKQQTQTILEIFTDEKERGSINVGIHLDTEDVASVLLQAQTAFGKGYRHGFSATTKINQNPWLSLRYSLGNMKMRSLNLTYNLSYKDFRLMDHGERMSNITFMRNYFKMDYKDYAFKNFKYEVGLRYDIFSDVSNLYTPQYIKYNSPNEDYLSGYAQIDYDTTNDRETPTRGTKFSSKIEIYGNDLFNHNRMYFGVGSFNILGVCPLNKRFSLIPELFGRFIIGDAIPGYFANHIGGEYNERYLQGQYAFYGVHFAEIMDEKMVGARMTLRYAINKSHYISCIGNYLLNSHEMKDIFKSHDYLGGAIKYTYNGMLGPLSLSLDYSSRTKELGFFASIGYFF